MRTLDVSDLILFSPCYSYHLEATQFCFQRFSVQMIQAKAPSVLVSTLHLYNGLQRFA